MQVKAILNRDGGTLAGADVAAIGDRIVAAFAANDRSVEVEIVAGAELIETLDRVAADPAVDAIIAGGGDGTISAAAAAAWRGGKTLGVLPAGTMNLFARALRLPLDLDQAIETIASATPTDVDIATADDRPFVHQISIGLQAETVRLRRALPYRGKISKMLASLRAAIRALRRARSVRAVIEVDGATFEGRFTFIGVSNNPYGDGHMPYPDRLDSGVLGVYRAGRMRGGRAARLAADLLRGEWRANPDLKFEQATSATLSFPGERRLRRMTIDGELVALGDRIEVQIHPSSLTVLAPTPAASP